jgi:hypothetical protein
MVWRGLEGTLNDKNTKGCGVSSLGGGDFNNLEARAIGSVGTAQPSAPGVLSLF